LQGGDLQDTRPFADGEVRGQLRQQEGHRSHLEDAALPREHGGGDEDDGE
jgi:hypothetical protein